MTAPQLIAHYQRLGKPVPADLAAMAEAANPAVLTGNTTLQGGKAHGRHTDGEMNGVERRHLEEIIQPAVVAGEILWWEFEQIRFRLADKTWYKPDFVLQLRNGRMLIHEVKGRHWEDDARVKIKVCAEKYPKWTVRAWQWTGTEWKVEDFS